jgi:outer membrane murein-binding lipoprotein Lpp
MSSFGERSAAKCLKVKIDKIVIEALQANVREEEQKADAGLQATKQKAITLSPKEVELQKMLDDMDEEDKERDKEMAALLQMQKTVLQEGEVLEKEATEAEDILYQQEQTIAGLENSLETLKQAQEAEDESDVEILPSTQPETGLPEHIATFMQTLTAKIDQLTGDREGAQDTPILRQFAAQQTVHNLRADAYQTALKDNADGFITDERQQSTRPTQTMWGEGQWEARLKFPRRT